MGILSIQDCIGGVVTRLIPHAYDQLLKLLVFFSPLLHGFSFCSKSPMGKEVVCEAKQFLEIEVCSWTDVTLVNSV